MFKAHIVASKRSAVRYSPQTNRLLERTTTEHFGWIRNINVNLQVAGYAIELSIDICNKSSPVKMIHHPGRGGNSVFTQDLLDHLSSELNAVVRIIAARDGDSKFQKADLDELRKKMQSVVYQHGK
jgi:hypothetical protein